MKNMVLISFAIFIMIVVAWVVIPYDSTTIVLNDSNSEQLKIQDLRLQVQSLKTKLVDANQALLEMHNDSQNYDRGNDDNNLGYAFYSEQESMPANYNDQSFAPDDPRSKLPKIEMVNPTPEQNENYETLKAQLDDPTFLYSLNLQEFASKNEIINLPGPMKMALLGKAIKQYNQGNISKEVFLGLETNE